MAGEGHFKEEPFSYSWKVAKDILCDIPIREKGAIPPMNTYVFLLEWIYGKEIKLYFAFVVSLVNPDFSLFIPHIFYWELNFNFWIRNWLICPCWQFCNPLCDDLTLFFRHVSWRAFKHPCPLCYCGTHSFLLLF